jgi:hypothetical protein
MSQCDAPTSVIALAMPARRRTAMIAHSDNGNPSSASSTIVETIPSAHRKRLERNGIKPSARAPMR